MKILVTGSDGFIGYHLLNYLCKYKKYKLFGSFYKKKKLKKINNVYYQKCDFRKYNQIFKLINKVKPNIIYHLAAKSHPTFSFKRPIETLETNIMGTAKLFESCKILKIKPKIIVACSSAQYGSKTKKELPIEEISESFPEHIYGFSKLVQNLLSLQYFKMYNIKIYRAIIFNTSGLGKNFDVFQDICRQFIKQNKNKSIILKVGNLQNLRDFTHVQDAVNGLVKIEKKGKAGESYIISSNKLIKISKIIDILKKCTTKKVFIKKNKKLFRKFDEKYILGCNKKIKKLGWKQKKSIVDIVLDIIN